MLTLTLPLECDSDRPNLSDTRDRRRKVSGAVSGTKAPQKQRKEPTRRSRTPESLARARAVKERITSERQTTRITVGDWAVYKGDTYNWHVEHGNDELRYFPTIDGALNYLLRQRIGERARKDIACVLAAVKSAEAEIVKALR